MSFLAAFWCVGASWAAGQTGPGGLIYVGNYQNDAFDSLTFVNSVVGWDLFYNSGFMGSSTVIGNIEAGQVWYGHEAFVRDPGALTGYHTYTNPAEGSLNQIDYHATMVGHVLAGTGYVVGDGQGAYTYVGLGMAPTATLVSAGVAVEFSASNPGSFSTSESSVVTAYQAFFQGVGMPVGVERPDVINSSWGGGDPAASSREALAIDGLAYQNSSVTLVASAGNDAAGAVSFPAAGYNSIAVGSLGGPSFLQASEFSSRGMVDFYNPQSGVTLTGVRAAVDLAAPGERFALAAYLGNSGTYGASPELAVYVQEPSPTNLYFLNEDGTSFAAPMVAGAISLLKDAAKTLLDTNGNAMDSRVVKSVLMAGSQKTIGWNNGQDAMHVTTQALDLATGAGALDLVGAANVYYFGTQDVPGDGGGLIANSGWDMATIPIGGVADYTFAAEFTQEMSLTVALNWLAERGFDNLTQSGSDLAFANLDLQVWLLDGTGQFSTMVGESMSTYNNTEFLRLDSIAAGRYGLRMVFGSMVFDTTSAVTMESYGLAWQAVVIPEPGVTQVLGWSLIVGLWRRRRN